jgi:VanZ family protein
VPPVAWGLFIVLLTSIPNPPQPLLLPTWSDKVVHVALYAVFGALVARALAHTEVSPRPLMFAALIAATLGAVDEWHQQYVTGRAADIYDWYADVSGGIAGSFLAIATFRREFRT